MFRPLNFEDCIDVLDDLYHSLGFVVSQLRMDLLALFVEFSWILSALSLLLFLLCDLFFTLCDFIDCLCLFIVVKLKTPVKSILSFSCSLQLSVETVSKNPSLRGICCLEDASVVEILLPLVALVLNELL